MDEVIPKPIKKTPKKKTSGHDILDRVALIDKRYIEDLDITLVPTDPDSFLSWFWDQAKGCTNCMLCETRTQVVKPDGISTAKIMIIGEGPGFMEDLTGVPMVGPLELRGSRCSMCRNSKDCYSHKIIKAPNSKFRRGKVVDCVPNMATTRQLDGGRFYIKSAGSILDGIIINKWNMNYPRHNWIKTYNENHPNDPFGHQSPWFVTNITLCRTTDVTGIKDKPPEGVPIDKCKRWLAMQWAALNPELIVCFGRVALGVLLGNKEKAKSVPPNTIIVTKFGPVLFQNHPAFFMREENKETKAIGFAKVASTLEKALQYVGLPI